MTPIEIAAIAFSFLTVYTLGVFTWPVGQVIKKKGTIDHIEIDADTLSGPRHVVKPRGNEVTYGAGEKARTVRLTARARLMIDGRPTWITLRNEGFNLTPDTPTIRASPEGTPLVPPPPALLNRDPVMRFLGIDNPRANAHANATNDARDAVLANSDEEPWIAKLIWPILIMGILSLGAIIYVIYILSKSGAV